MSQMTGNLVERFRSRDYAGESDAAGDVFEVSFRDLPERIERESGLTAGEACTVFSLAVALAIRRLTADEALRLASSAEAARLMAAEFEREQAWDEGKVVRFRPRR